MNQLKNIKDIYESTEIPGELEFVVKKTIRRHKMKTITKNFVLSAAALMLIFTGSINLNQNIAIAMSNVPVVGSIVHVLNFRFDVIENDNVYAKVEAPVIEGLENKELANALNSKYYEESKALYDEFVEEMGDIIAQDGHLGVESGYEIITDTEDILSLGRYTVNIVGSSSTEFKYDTIDKKNNILITLPGLFKDDQYVEIISQYIKETMKEKMEEDDGLVYWVNEEDIEPFENIDANQPFYITPEQKLVISFNKYEVAPGYMGVVKFEIPTEIISHLLVGDMYIK
ncbi:MAG: DUF3298 domain-containing protein [Clostridia bacterium]|nr:DUF3298 domain-containing protein [Clostridia bacterium]